MHRSRLSGGFFTFGAIISGSAATLLAAPPALDYTDQKSTDPVAPSFIHSYIVASAGGNIRDDKFADMVAKHVTQYNELIFAFMECCGGGMFDELTAKAFTDIVMTSAARHDQSSLALKGDAPAVQSTYNYPYAPKAGSAAPVGQKAAATFARANDYAGVLRPETVLPAAVKQREDPQYLSDGATADAIKLHTNSGVNPTANNKYLSILWGGANANLNDVLTNGTTLNTISNEMVAAGYVPAEVRQLTTPGPNFTTYAGMAKAWKDLGAASTNNTQVFFWASWGHGTSMLDAVAKKKFQAAQAPKKGLAFGVSYNDSPDSLAFYDNFTDAYDYWTAQGAPNLLPYFEIDSQFALSSPSVSINGISLSLLGSDVQDRYDDGTQLDYTYRFAIDPAVYASITDGMSNYIIDYLGGPAGSDLDFLSAGLTLGDAFNGVEVPEPTMGLVIVAVGALISRRRR